MNLSEYLREAINLSNYHWNWNALPKFIEAAINFGLGLFVFLKNPRARINRAYLAVMLPVLFWLPASGLYLCTYNAHLIGFYDRNIGQIGTIFLAVGMIVFSSVMCGLEKKRMPWIILGYVIGIVLYSLFVLFPDTFLPDAYYKYSWGPYPKALAPYAIIYPLFAIYVVWSLLTYWQTYKATTSPIEKNRIKYVFLAFGIFIFGAVDWLPAWGINCYPCGAFFGMCFDGIMAYAIISQKLFDIETLALRTTMWLVTSILVLVPLYGFLYVMRLWGVHLSDGSVLALFVVFAFYWSAVQAKIDQVFQKRRHNLKQVLAEYVADLSALKNLGQVQSQLKKVLNTRLYVESISLFVEQEEEGHFRELPAAGTASSASRSPRVAAFVKDNPFIAWLQNKNEAVTTEEILVFIKDASHLYKDGSDELLKSALDFITINEKPYLIVPLTTQAGLVGWIALSRRIDGRVYNQAELEFLDQLRKSLAIAVSNSMLYDQVQQFNASLETTVKVRTQELQQANERLQQLDVAKTEFLVMANHELRHPLSAVRGFADMLMLMWDTLQDTRKKKLVEVIQDSSTQMLGLITDFLDVSKIELGRFDINRKPTRMTQLTENVTEQMRVQYKKLHFAVDFSSSDLILDIDPDKIQQVLMNLIGNAVKYSPEDGTVKIVGKKENGQFLMGVEDEGPGIPKEHLDKLFQKFYRIETADPNARKGPQVRGTGLGLTIAKSIVEMHGGKIWVENRKDRSGARFCFSLPIAI